MKVKRCEKFFSKELYKEVILTARDLLTRQQNAFFTNNAWDKQIVKDSFPVLIHNIYRNSELFNKMREEIENKTNFFVNEQEIMLYYWSRFSYIPWHNDPHCDAALTVYLNENWEPDFGGYFIYENDKNDLRAIVPEANLGILQESGVLHTTTAVNFEGQFRFSVQVFLSKNKTI